MLRPGFISRHGGIATPTLTETAGLVFRLRAQDLALSNGDPVTTGTDTSGTAQDVTQATGAKKPIFNTAQINGRAAIVYDGVDDELARGSLSVPANTGLTVYTVARLDAAGSYPMMVTYGSAVNELRFFDTARRPEWVGVHGSSTSATALTLGTWHTFCGVNSTAGVSGEIFVDGVSKGTSTGGVSTATSADFWLGSRGGSFYFQGAEAEVLVYDRPHDATARSNVLTYFTNYYGV